MPQIDEPTSPAPKAAPEARKAKPTVTDKPSGGVYSFTVDTGKGRIISVESVDDGGNRRPLTVEQRTELAKTRAATPLRHLVERAFEAGIECVLGEAGGTEAPESKEEKELSSVLLRTLMEGSKVRELIKDETLDRTLVETLIGQAVTKSPTPASTH